jgi:hypothetical protein
MKQCSTSLIIKEIQIKTTLRFHLVPVRMAIFKGNKTNKCCHGCGETGTLLHFWWECKLVQPLRKAVWRYLKKLKAELPYDPVIPLLGIYPKEHKSGYKTDTWTPMLIAAQVIVAKLWKQPRCNRWMSQEIVVYIHNGVLFIHKECGLKVNWWCNWRTSCKVK